MLGLAEFLSLRLVACTSNEAARMLGLSDFISLGLAACWPTWPHVRFARLNSVGRAKLHVSPNMATCTLGLAECISLGSIACVIKHGCMYAWLG